MLLAVLWRNVQCAVSICQRYPGEARNAIAAVFASTADVKNVFVVDDDIDVFDDGQIDLGAGDTVSGRQAILLPDPISGGADRSVLEGRRSGSKGGFDCTKPLTLSRLAGICHSRAARDAGTYVQECRLRSQRGPPRFST